MHVSGHLMPYGRLISLCYIISVWKKTEIKNGRDAAMKTPDQENMKIFKRVSLIQERRPHPKYKSVQDASGRSNMEMVEEGTKFPWFF